MTAHGHSLRHAGKFAILSVALALAVLAAAAPAARPAHAYYCCTYSWNPHLAIYTDSANNVHVTSKDFSAGHMVNFYLLSGNPYVAGTSTLLASQQQPVISNTDGSTSIAATLEPPFWFTGGPVYIDVYDPPSYYYDDSGEICDPHC
jgi:hypothetical protein